MEAKQKTEEIASYAALQEDERYDYFRAAVLWLDAPLKEVNIAYSISLQDRTKREKERINMKQKYAASYKPNPEALYRAFEQQRQHAQV